MDDAGRFAAFSSADDLVGENPGNDEAVYLLDLELGVVEQVDLSTGALGRVFPVLSDDGGRLYYSYFDQATVRGELRVFETETGVLSTALPGEFQDLPLVVGVSADGSRVVVWSKIDPFGQNPERIGQFLELVCGKETRAVVEVPALSTWGLGVLVLLLAGVGMWRMRE